MSVPFMTLFMSALTAPQTVADLSSWYNTVKDRRADELDKLRNERWEQYVGSS